MHDKDLNQYIIKHLADGKDPNDLILEICNHTGMNWPDVEARVNHVRNEHQDEIARKQSPLLVIIALAMFLGGIGILGYELYILSSLLSNYSKISQQPFVILDLAAYFPNYILLFLEGTPIAVAMILGSLLGMSQVWSSILFPNDSSD